MTDDECPMSNDAEERAGLKGVGRIGLLAALCPGGHGTGENGAGLMSS